MHWKNLLRSCQQHAKGGRNDEHPHDDSRVLAHIRVCDILRTRPRPKQSRDILKYDVSMYDQEAQRFETFTNSNGTNNRGVCLY